MKKRLRLTPILIAIVMLLAMMPLISAPAYADDSYNLWVGTEEATSDKTSGTGWSFTPASGDDPATLTLNGVNITDGKHIDTSTYGIYYDGSEVLNIVLEGKNSIMLSPSVLDTYGIYTYSSDINISGDGSLDATVENSGIYAKNVTIESGEINAAGHMGIESHSTVTISGGTVKAEKCFEGILCKDLLVSGGSVDVMCYYNAIRANDSVTISDGEVKVTGSASTGISGKSIEISGGSVESTGGFAGLESLNEDIKISGGSVTAVATDIDGNAMRSARHIDIEGGSVEATGGDVAIQAVGNVEIIGGSVTASGDTQGIEVGDGYGVEIGRSVRIRAGDDKDHASDVTETFKQDYADYKWVHAEKCTLWVGGIPVTSANAEDILGDLDKSVTAKYEESTKTLTLNNYSYESEGYNYDPINAQYAAIYADQNLTIQFKGDNTVKCTEKESSEGHGIYAKGDDKNDRNLVISGSGTLNARGYGYGCGIYVRNDDIMIDGGTVNASGNTGISTDKKEIKINGGIVTATGTDRGFSGYEVTAADDMGINAGESKETAVDVDKEIFKNNHLQEWVQVSKAYPLWVRGIRVMVANMDDVLSDGKVSFDPKTNTLKLKGATITAGDKDTNGIKYSGKTPLNIESKSGSLNKVNGVNNCIYSSDGGQLVFSGKGTLNVTASGSNGIGIKSDAGIVIKDGSKLTAKGKAKAIDEAVKNYITGTGWTDYEGKATAVQIKKSTDGAKLTKYKKVQFPEKVSGTPTAKMQAGKTSVTISWNKINGAEGYDIFFAMCDNHGKKITCKKVKNIKGNKTFKWTKSGLKNGTAYKAYVKAYVIRDGKKTYVSTSPVMHAYTGGGNKKYTNAKSVTVKKKKVSLKKGKTYKIKAKVNKLKKGKITAKGSGTCTITVFAHNGVSKNIKVTVK